MPATNTNNILRVVETPIRNDAQQTRHGLPLYVIFDPQPTMVDVTGTTTVVTLGPSPPTPLLVDLTNTAPVVIDEATPSSPTAATQSTSTRARVTPEVVRGPRMEGGWRATIVQGTTETSGRMSHSQQLLDRNSENEDAPVLLGDAGYAQQATIGCTTRTKCKGDGRGRARELRDLMQGCAAIPKAKRRR